MYLLIHPRSVLTQTSLCVTLVRTSAVLPSRHGVVLTNTWLVWTVASLPFSSMVSTTERVSGKMLTTLRSCRRKYSSRSFSVMGSPSFFLPRQARRRVLPAHGLDGFREARLNRALRLLLFRAQLPLNGLRAGQCVQAEQD